MMVRSRVIAMGVLVTAGVSGAAIAETAGQVQILARATTPAVVARVARNRTAPIRPAALSEQKIKQSKLSVATQFKAVPLDGPPAPITVSVQAGFTAAGYIEFLGPVGVDPSRDMGFMPYQTAANTAANAVGEHTAVVKFSNVIANKLYLMDCSVFEYFGGLTVFALAAGTSSAGAEQALTVSSDGHVLLGFESSSKSVAVSLRATGAPDTPVWILYGCNLHAVN